MLDSSTPDPRSDKSRMASLVTPSGHAESTAKTTTNYSEYKLKRNPIPLAEPDPASRYPVNFKRDGVAVTLTCIGGAMSILIGALLTMMMIIGVSFTFPRAELILISLLAAALVGLAGCVLGAVMMTWHFKSKTNNNKQSTQPNKGKGASLQDTR